MTDLVYCHFLMTLTVAMVFAFQERAANQQQPLVDGPVSEILENLLSGGGSLESHHAVMWQRHHVVIWHLSLVESHVACLCKTVEDTLLH